MTCEEFWALMEKEIENTTRAERAAIYHHLDICESCNKKIDVIEKELIPEKPEKLEEEKEFNLEKVKFLENLIFDETKENDPEL